jgi:hypothetical protein
MTAKALSCYDIRMMVQIRKLLRWVQRRILRMPTKQPNKTNEMRLCRAEDKKFPDLRPSLFH